MGNNIYFCVPFLCRVYYVPSSPERLRSSKFSRRESVSSAVSSPDATNHYASEGGAEAEGEQQICFHVKEAWNLNEVQALSYDGEFSLSHIISVLIYCCSICLSSKLFHTRYTLHKRAYQHRVCNAIELMLVEIMRLSDPYFFVPGSGGRPTRMSQCPEDMQAYWRLGEYMLKQVENSFEKVSRSHHHVYLYATRVSYFNLFNLCGFNRNCNLLAT